jgi:Na+/citrate or Na+/malate symporter
MNNDQISPGDSLRIIRDMIDKTRQDFSDNSKYFLLWGWAAFAGCIGQFILKVIFNYPRHYLVWLITIVCAVATVIMVIKDKRREVVKTYVSETMSSLWTGLGISFTVISVLFSRIGWQYCFPFYILLYGLGTFLSGRILKYRPLMIGGVISFVLAAVSVWLPYDYQILSAAGSLLSSYIIPGHMLRIRYQRDKSNRYATTTINS